MSARIPHEAMAWELANMIASNAKWLAEFSRGRHRRPDWNVRQMQRRLEVLEQAQADYRRAAERDAKKKTDAA